MSTGDRYPRDDPDRFGAPTARIPQDPPTELYPPEARGPRRPRASDPGRIDTGRFWAGGVATAIVAGLVAAVGVLIADAVFGVRPVAPAWLPGNSERWGVATRFAGTAVLAALVAAALLYLLLLSTPRPRAFFLWIVLLVTVAAVASVFRYDVSLQRQLITGLITAAIGLAIASLLAGVANRTARYGADA
jgi:hypothetical protein